MEFVGILFKWKLFHLRTSTVSRWLYKRTWVLINIEFKSAAKILFLWNKTTMWLDRAYFSTLIIMGVSPSLWSSDAQLSTTEHPQLIEFYSFLLIWWYSRWHGHLFAAYGALLQAPIWGELGRNKADGHGHTTRHSRLWEVRNTVWWQNGE